ncbi:hypothetical protein [Paraburkholderia youngii]|uniref:hypothetical protein n=1 Tax=Paraburkholderia youngii TaxID=2782701 RepID=UPI001FE60582|nr:hypothetical protein [Paraburkholderia youngii]
MNLPAEPPQELAARYGLGPVEVPLVTGKIVEIAPFEIGRMIVDGLGRFCRSADDTPNALHVLVDEKIDAKAGDWLRDGLRPYVGRLWSESIDPRGRSAIIPDRASGRHRGSQCNVRTANVCGTPASTRFRSVLLQ